MARQMKRSPSIGLCPRLDGIGIAIVKALQQRAIRSMKCSYMERELLFESVGDGSGFGVGIEDCGCDGGGTVA